MKPEPRLCNVCRIWRGRTRLLPKNCAYTSSNGSRTVRRTTRSVLIFTTAGKTLATAKTAGSEAGSACPKHDGEAATVNKAATTQTARFFRRIRAASNEAAFGLSTCRYAQSSEINSLCAHQLTLAQIFT